MIRIFKPVLRDLWFREKLLSDEQTMSYNAAWGGAIPFPKEEIDYKDDDVVMVKREL